MFETKPRRRRDVENRVEGIHEDASLLTYLVRRVVYNYYGTTDFAGLVNDPSVNSVASLKKKAASIRWGIRKRMVVAGL